MSRKANRKSQSYLPLIKWRNKNEGVAIHLKKLLSMMEKLKDYLA